MPAWPKVSAKPGADIRAVAVNRSLETGGWHDENYAYLVVGSEPHVKIDSFIAAN